MNATIVKEATDILKRLSPENQAYFMTLVRVAAVSYTHLDVYKRQ